MRLIGSTLVLLIFLALSAGHSETILKIDGRESLGLNSQLLPGVPYVQALQLAQAMGAKYVLDRNALLATFDLGGRVLRIKIVKSAEDALVIQDGLMLNDSQPFGPPGIISEGFLFVPLQNVLESFNASLTYLDSEDYYLAVLPRAKVENHQVLSKTNSDRIVINLSQYVPHGVFFNSAVDTLTVRFERTDLLKSLALNGKGFKSAKLIPGSGFTELQVELEPDYTYFIFELPSENGINFILDILPASQEELDSRVNPQRIVIDPGHGGEEVGQLFIEYGWERDLVFDFSEQLAKVLKIMGFTVELTRSRASNPRTSSRSGQGFGANLFVSVHAADYPRGQYSIFYLEEAEGIDGLDYAVRENAGQEMSDLGTNQIRRQILLELIPNLDMGRRFAFALNDIMFQESGYVANTPRAAPIAVLAGAAGRGLLLEFGPQDLTSTSLIDAVASALNALATGGF